MVYVLASQNEKALPAVKSSDFRYISDDISAAVSYMKVIHGPFDQTIASLENSLYVRATDTYAHAERMANYCKAFREELDLSDSENERLVILAKLHDIGKLAIPYSILNKPGTLNENELEIIKRHPEIGYHYAKLTPELLCISEEILAHHERWDGKGYPRHIKENEIPFLSQIISIVDAYDAITHERCYKKFTKTHDEAIAEVEKCAGKQFNPQLVKQFVCLKEKKLLNVSAVMP